MGKRSDFKKVEKDQYLTPYSAVLPLLPFLPKNHFTFAEPCAGDGRLIQHLESASTGHCKYTSDISPEDFDDPKVSGILQKDALEITKDDLGAVELIITNPPWSRDKASGYVLHKMISHFSNMLPTWLLFDADWAHTKQAIPFIRDRLVSVVSVGRVKWIEDSSMSGKDNCAWYLFDKSARGMGRHPTFFGREYFT